jgi:hypothetical protein
VPRCLDCADLGHLVFLPRGDTALTRRSREESALSAVVVRFNRRRGRYERQGVLVEEAGLARAEERCLADAEARRRRRVRDAGGGPRRIVRFTEAFAAEIRRLFPGCPEDRAGAIAAHASARGSGRVGRSAAGRALSEGAVVSAVAPSVRHVDTPYDQLLMSGVPRHEARRRIAVAVEGVLRGGGRAGFDAADEECGGRVRRSAERLPQLPSRTGATRGPEKVTGPRRPGDDRTWPASRSAMVTRLVGISLG